MKIKNLDEIAEIRAGYPTPKNKEFFKDGIYDFIKTSDVGKIKIGSIKSSLTFAVLNECIVLLPKIALSKL